MTFAEINTATAKELSTFFKVSLSAGEAASNYFMALGWGYSIENSTRQAACFIENDSDIDGLEAILRYVAKL